MKRVSIFFIGMLFFNALSYSQGTSLTNFPQLVGAVQSATDVRAIIYFDKCIIQNQNQSVQVEIMRILEEASTRFNFNIFFHGKELIDTQSRDTVSTSMKMFFEHPSTGDFLTLFGRLKIFEDNTALLRVIVYDPIAHKKQFIIEWLCEISNGKDEKGLYLYDFP